jgi:hypothetical protein
MKKYQGEDISFIVEFQKGENTNINSFIDLSEVILYIYTDGCDIVRFRYPAKNGYETLTLTDSVTLTGIISASKTKIMAPGSLRVEAKIKKGAENMIEKKITGVIVAKDLIKSEI